MLGKTDVASVIGCPVSVLYGDVCTSSAGKVGAVAVVKNDAVVRLDVSLTMAVLGKRLVSTSKGFVCSSDVAGGVDAGVVLVVVVVAGSAVQFPTAVVKNDVAVWLDVSLTIVELGEGLVSTSNGVEGSSDVVDVVDGVLSGVVPVAVVVVRSVVQFPS